MPGVALRPVVNFEMGISDGMPRRAVTTMGDSTKEWAHNRGQEDRKAGKYKPVTWVAGPLDEKRRGEISEAYARGWKNTDDQTEDDD